MLYFGVKRNIPKTIWFLFRQQGSVQARNQAGRRGGETPPRNFFAPLEKCVEYSLKILDIVQKIWAPLRKLFAPPGVSSWLRAWFSVLK